MTQYHLIAITEDQRKSLLAALDDNPYGLGDDMFFLENTLKACDPEELNDIDGIDSAYHVKTTRPAEIAYLEGCVARERGWAEEHRAKGEKLLADGFAVSAQYDLGVAANCEARALATEAKIQELKNG